MGRRREVRGWATDWRGRGGEEKETPTRDCDQACTQWAGCEGQPPTRPTPASQTPHHAAPRNYPPWPAPTSAVRRGEGRRTGGSRGRAGKRNAKHQRRGSGRGAWGTRGEGAGQEGVAAAGHVMGGGERKAGQHLQAVAEGGVWGGTRLQCCRVGALGPWGLGPLSQRAVRGGGQARTWSASCNTEWSRGLQTCTSAVTTGE